MFPSPGLPHPDFHKVMSGCTNVHPDMSCSLFPVDESIEAFVVGCP